MLRYFFIACILGAISIAALAGFRGSKSAKPPIEIFPDMDHQPKFQPQHPSTFFADGRASREPIAGTVPMGYNLPGRYYQVTANNHSDTAGFSNLPDYQNTGKIGDKYGDGFP